MQGQGQENHFLGIPTNLEEANVVVVPVPFDKTTSFMHGSDKGPSAMIEASRNIELFDIETDIEASEFGIHTAKEVREETSEKMLQSTYESVKSFLKEGKFVITLGGEHAISAAPIRAHAEKYGPISVLQLDAHADLAPAYEGNPLSHASVMSRVREMENVKRIVPVGIRSMSVEENAYIQPENTFFAHDLFENDKWMDQVIDRLTDNVYITFDLDVFDSSLMPSTGTPEPGGLFWHTALKLLKKVTEKRKIIGFDVVELCPIQNFWAPDYLAAKLIYKLLSYTLERQNEYLRLPKKELSTL